MRNIFETVDQLLQISHQRGCAEGLVKLLPLEPPPLKKSQCFNKLNRIGSASGKTINSFHY